ncbi:serine/threonine-protein kinase [Actinoallomurus oryzae]|uniref:serine/threonine-protein kinase n=1 Tax=Actinoallomurus oryzae TaxID=502180 RepID=UPI0031F0F937
MDRPSAPKTIGGEVLPPGAEPLEAGDPAEIGGHRLTARLSTDGTSIAYLASGADGGHVVVKTTRAPDQTQARRDLRIEASCARRLPPFCTVALLTDGTDHTPPYLVREYIEGPSLAQYVETLGPLDAEQLMALAVALGRAIAAVHGAGLIHCDLRPANILLAANGPRIIGFSIAQEAPVSGRPAELGTVPYEPGWVAPERVDGFPAGPASDIFGWGCLIGYAATGHSPYDGNGGDGRWSVAGEENLAALDEPIRGLVEAALAVNPADRPSTGEIASRLGGTAEKPRPISPPAQRALPARPVESSVDAPTAPMSIVAPEILAELTGEAPPAPSAPPAAREPVPDLPRRRPHHVPEAVGTDAFPTSATDALATEALATALTTESLAASGLQDDGHDDAPVASSPHPAGSSLRNEAPPRRVDYSSGTAGRPRREPERRPRRLRAVAMVAAPAALVAVLATVIAMVATGAKDQPAGPSSAVRPGQGPADSGAPTPPAPDAPGRRSYRPRHAAAAPAPSGSPTPTRRRPTATSSAPSRPSGGHKPGSPHPSSPPPKSHTPTPTPTPTPTETAHTSETASGVSG